MSNNASSAFSGISGPPQSSDLEWIAKPKLVRDAVVETIRHAIIHGDLAPGAKLVERELCEATGAGRASIREALRQLEADRLVVIEAHKGPTVASLTPDQANEVYELRAELEVRLMRRFCQLATAQDIARLRALFADVKAAAKAKDKQAVIDRMGRFNEHVMDVSQLEVTSDLLRSLLYRISRLRAFSLTAEGRMPTSIEGIARIVDAARRRDEDAAEEAIRTHVRNAAATALELLAHET